MKQKPLIAIVSIGILIILLISIKLSIQTREFFEDYELKELPTIIEPTKSPQNVKDVPCNVLQYWHTRKVMPGMYNTVIENAKNNPEFKFYIFNEENSIPFLQEHFGQDAVDAFNKLKPHAYKADLVRLCSAYVYGGVYMDMKFKTVKPLKEYTSLNETMFAKNDGEDKVFNGFYIVKKKEPIVKKCIDKIIKDIQTNTYGIDPHWPTGPGAIGAVMKDENYTVPNTIIHFELVETNKHAIVDKTKNREVIIVQYPTYRDDQAKNGTQSYYWQLWHDKNIFNN